MPACDRLRASSAGDVVVAVAVAAAAAVVVEGVLLSWGLPCRDASGCAVLLPPMGLRSPVLMLSVVLGEDARKEGLRLGLELASVTA